MAQTSNQTEFPESADQLRERAHHYRSLAIFYPGDELAVRLCEFAAELEAKAAALDPEEYI